jgi:hypothetical protein
VYAFSTRITQILTDFLYFRTDHCTILNLRKNNVSCPTKRGVDCLQYVLQFPKNEIKTKKCATKFICSAFFSFYVGLLETTHCLDNPYIFHLLGYTNRKHHLPTKIVRQPNYFSAKIAPYSKNLFKFVKNLPSSIQKVLHLCFFVFLSF